MLHCPKCTAKRDSLEIIGEDQTKRLNCLQCNFKGELKKFGYSEKTNQNFLKALEFIYTKLLTSNGPQISIKLEEISADTNISLEKVKQQLEKIMDYFWLEGWEVDFINEKDYCYWWGRN